MIAVFSVSVVLVLLYCFYSIVEYIYDKNERQKGGVLNEDFREFGAFEVSKFPTLKRETPKTVKRCRIWL